MNEPAILIGIIFVAAALALRYFLWSIPYKRSVANTRKVLAANPGVMHSYRAMYNGSSYLHQLNKDELYVSNDRIWMEKSGEKLFDADIKTISSITYSKYAITFNLNDGSQHKIFSLHLDPATEGLFVNELLLGSANHRPTALITFLDDVHSLSIPLHEDGTGIKPRSYYQGLVVIIIVSCFVIAGIIYNLFYR